MITIRKATSRDAMEAFKIRNAAIKSQCEGYYAWADLEFWTSPDMADEFAKIAKDNLYVSEMDGNIIGTGMIDLDSGYLDAIFVHPDSMGLGAGRKMLSFLEGLATSAGLTRITLDSTLNASSFYRRRGYVGDEIAKYKSPLGVVLDCIPMTKNLDQ